MKTGLTRLRTSALMAALALSAGTAVAQSVGKWESISVRDLISAGGIKLNQRVQLIGTVDAVDIKSEIYADKYVLKGYQGQSIPVVFTSDRPLPPQDVIVRGTFSCDDAGQFFINESRRRNTDRKEVIALIQGGIVSAIDTLARKYFESGSPPGVESASTEPQTSTATGSSSGKPAKAHSVWLYTAIGVVAVLAVAVIIILIIVLSRPGGLLGTSLVTEPKPAAAQAGTNTPPAPPEDDVEMTVVRRDGRVEMDIEKTMVRAPGDLEVISGGHPGTKINLTRPSSIIGRDHSNPPRQGHFIALDMSGRNEEEKRSLSRQQCRISYEVNNDEFTVENVATSGTAIWVNGNKLSYKDAAPINNGDTLELEPDWKFVFRRADRG